jgi:uncharacterized membrane protein HdeD (DUF308 family)
MPNRILRFAAPVLVFMAGLGAFFAASQALGSSDDDTFAYVVGVGLQLLAVGSATAWLSSAERSNSEGWARTHVRQAGLLYILTAALILLWPNAGHGSGVVKFTAILAAAGVAANGLVLLATRHHDNVAA